MVKMHVASIVPIPYLNLVKGKLYQMCLAHLALQHDGYADFYRNEKQNGAFVLLDNGAAENAQPALDLLVRAIEKVQPTEVILPDVIYDSEQTLDRSYRAIHKIKQHFDVKLMAVPQGSTVSEWVSCAQAMLTWPISSIGISKFMSYKLGPCIRSTLFHLIERDLEQHHVEVHLLGCAYDPREIGALNFVSNWIRGTDSSIPYVYARQGENVYTAVKSNVPRDQNEIDFTDSSVNAALLAANIRVWEDICHGELF